MKYIVCTCLLSSFCLTYSVAQQWKASFKNILIEKNNTLLLLQYEALGNETRDYLIEINFRPKGTFSVTYSKEHSLQVKNDATASLGFNIPVGEYEVAIDILDRKENEHWFQEIIYECNIVANQTSLSDIFLSYEPLYSVDGQADLRPNLTPTLIKDSTNLFFLMEIYAPNEERLRSKAVIFKDYPGRTSDEAYNFSSEDNKNEYPIVENGKGIYSDYFDLQGLGEGEYELTIYIYDGDDRFIDEKTVNFIIEGSIKQRVYSDPNTSILMMKYATFSDRKIEEMLSIEEPSLKLEAFKKAWQELYGTRRWNGQLEEIVEDRMEAYYQKIFEADEKLSREGETWNSDRGRIFVNYGQATKEEDVYIKGIPHQRWTYIPWSLSFLFEKRNQSFYLVE